ncbi:hypothetical protein PVAND_012266 [Polypedilum vanderplanki]|uniref:Peptidase S1 domain-containing protein n=1 Tax=Polypedilum vanderplanki TaxID=319348 RepID=A0A9J6CLW2_POLVA|nr:hypothetical protein PVAND_012266 [Polypedilum vanderplanki]
MESIKIFSAIVLFLNSIYAQRIPVLHNGNENQPIDHIPFVASLRLDDVDESYFGKGHFCTGVFISRKNVLTLASCFYQNDALLNPDEVRVVGGTKYKYEQEIQTFSTILNEILIHDNFSRSSLENNIAIGYLTDELPKDNQYVKSINLLSQESPVENLNLKIYGWSLTTRFEESLHLLDGTVVVTAIENCDPAFNKITTTTICAGPYHVNGCETDDGAPLVTEDGILYGLIDARPAGYCSKIITNRLGTYVDISKFYEWILEHNENSAIRGNKISLITILFFVFLLQFNAIFL